MFCHAIVLYTTTVDETRNKISDYLETALKGTPIDQSSFLIEKDGGCNVRNELISLCEQLTFDPKATLKVCHSAELFKENYKDSGKDKIVVYSIVENGKVLH